MSVKSRRALTAVLFLAAAVAVAWLLAARTAPAPPRSPKAVKDVFTAGAQIGRVLVIETGPTNAQYLADRASRVGAIYARGQLTSLRVSGETYSRTASGCYVNTSSTMPVPTFTQLLLPVNAVTGRTTVNYRFPHPGVIDWSSNGPAAGTPPMTPHGELILNPSTHLIMSGTVFGAGPGVQHIKVVYDPQMPTPGTPRNLCQRTPAARTR